MIIIFAGTIGRSGLGGQAWASLQYLLGFRALGHEVYYLEDCGESSWVFDWEKEEWTVELDYPAAYVRECLKPFGFEDRWIYRAGDKCLGLPLDQFQDVCSNAELLIMRAVPLWVWRPEYELPKRRAFIDVDPGFTQISIANGDEGLSRGIARCERRFTIAQRIAKPDCRIPIIGGPWFTTLPPVSLPHWAVADGGDGCFTSIVRWQGFREASFNGVAYGQRDKEFPKYIDLPRLTSQPFRIAVMGIEPEKLACHGWKVAPGEVVSKTPASYGDFIRASRAEFSVPKHGYVETRGGWFSDRSVCYLASGKPVLIEDTGLGDWMPSGGGVVPFSNLAGAKHGIADINANYERHCREARNLAETIFATDKVLPPFLETALN
ncbi:MAG TPA: glycosyltransferase family 1 protein [Verrucomicrobiae bacterium]|nr:glycosyltransferase family 1 protein [Verrucomicrobiae bacterium]